MKINLKALERKCHPQSKIVLEIASQIASKLKINLWLIGGPVRDLILGYENEDLDLLVDNKLKEFVSRLARRLHVNFNFTEFLTAKIQYDFPIDVGLTRKEFYPAPGSLPEVEKADLREDILRRDFTINALALKIEKGRFKELIDLIGGVNDLEAGYIRILRKDKFKEDPTRIIRAIIYEQRFGFKLEKNTLNCLKKAISDKVFSSITPQRLGKVIRRALFEEKVGKVFLRINELVGLEIFGSKSGFSPLDRRVLLRWDKYKRKKEIPFYWLFPILVILPTIKKIQIDDLAKMLECRKQEKEIITTFKRINIKKIKEKLDCPLSPSEIYVKLKKVPRIIVAYMYFYSRGKARNNFKNYLEEIANIRIEITGNDLKRIGIEEGPLMRKILEKVKMARINGIIDSKDSEIEYVKKLVKK